MNHLLCFLYSSLFIANIIISTARMIDIHVLRVVQQSHRPQPRSLDVFVQGVQFTSTKKQSIRYLHRHHTSAFVRENHDYKMQFSIYHRNIRLPSKLLGHRQEIKSRLSFSTSLNRMVPHPRSANSQYASRNSNDYDDYGFGSSDTSSSYYNSKSGRYINHQVPNRASSVTAAAPTTTFQYFAYSLTVSGLQLSALPFSSNDHVEEDQGYQENDAFQPPSRPFPPSLRNETSYGDDFFGAYQYSSNYDDTTSTNNISHTYTEDIYDESVPPKETSRFIPKTNIETKYTASKPNLKSNFSARSSANDIKQPQSYSKIAATNKPATIRPPVQVSIPSLTSNDGAKKLDLHAPIDVDLSTYDNIFNDDSKDNTSQDTERITPENSVEINKDPNGSIEGTTKRPVERESLIPATHFHVGQVLNDLPGYDPALDQFLSKAAYGVGTTTSVDVLQEELAAIEEAIYEQNNSQKFNINSPKQVSVALYGANSGTKSYSTNKDVLEGMAGAGNRLAALILEYRSIKYKIAKFLRQEENRNKGTSVRSAMTVARPTEASVTAMQSAVQTVASNVLTQPKPAVSEIRSVMADPLLLLDASAYIFRAYYSMPPIHRPDGMPTGAVMGFCKMLNSLLLNRMLEGEQPRLVLCFDAKGKTFRHEVYNKYKANRAAAPMDLVPQFDLVRQAAKAYGICQIEAQRFEADDVIATLACKAIEEGVDANIMSGDKDLMQLVTDLDATPSIQIIDPMKKERTTYQQVIEKWQVPPNKLGDLLALAGDTADNVPGVRGIGPKTAAKLINDFGSLENLLNNIDSVKQQGIREKLLEDKANARLSRILVELNCTVPMSELTGLPDGVNQKVSDLRMEAIDPDRIIAFYDQMGFKELKRSFQNSLKGLKVKRKKASSYTKRVKATIPTPEDYKDVPF